MGQHSALTSKKRFTSFYIQYANITQTQKMSDSWHEK